MKVLVTGSEGYIGTVLVPMLEGAGHDVFRLDMALFGSCAFEDLTTTKSRVRIGDIRDVSSDKLAGIDAVVHLAGLSNDPLSDLDPNLTISINHQAAVRFAEIARNSGIRRFVFASTCSVYGAQGDTFITETSPTSPLSTYAQSKLDAEHDISALADEFFSVVHLRNGTAYGTSPMARFDLVLNNLVAWAHSTGVVHLKSDGKAWRPLVHVEDICRAFLAGMELETVGANTFNIGRTRDNTRIRELAQVVSEQMACPVEFADGAFPDTRSYRVDCSLAESGLPGYSPVWDIEIGVAQVARFVREHDLDIRDIEGARYGRIMHLKKRMADGQIGPDLRELVRA